MYDPAWDALRFRWTKASIGHASTHLEEERLPHGEMEQIGHEAVCSPDRPQARYNPFVGPAHNIQDEVKTTRTAALNTKSL